MTEQIVISPKVRAKVRRGLAAEPSGPAKPGIDAQARAWTSNGGITFRLKPVSWAGAQRIQSDPRGRPKIPMTIVTYGGDMHAEEANPDDPAYKAAYEDWQANNNYRAMIYIIGLGVDLAIPTAFQDANRDFFPDASENETRYLYVASLIEPYELAALTEAILGQTGTTEEGIAAAEATFSGKR